jgi:hypothetical protein
MNLESSDRNFQRRLQRGREQILPLFIYYLRQAYVMHKNNNIEIKNEILTLCDLCVDALLKLNTIPADLEKIIISIGFRYFKRQFSTIEWYIERLLPGFDNTEEIDLESDDLNTNCNTDEEN